MNSFRACFWFASWCFQTVRKQVFIMVFCPLGLWREKSVAQLYFLLLFCPSSYKINSCFSCLLFLFLFWKILVLFLLWFFHWRETKNSSIQSFVTKHKSFPKCGVFLSRSRCCKLPIKSAPCYLLCCALDNRSLSSDFELSNWHLRLSGKVCHLHRVWLNEKTLQILFLVVCILSTTVINVLLLLHNCVVVQREKPHHSSFGSSFVGNTNSFWYNKQFLIQINLSNQTKTSETKIILGGFRTRDL